MPGGNGVLMWTGMKGSVLSPQKVSPIRHRVKATSAVKQEACLALVEKFASRKLFSFLWEAFGEHNGIHMFLSDPTAAARAS